MVVPASETPIRFFLASSVPLRIASGTAPALPSPIPTCPCSSPTTTRALKLKRLAPLVTLATRLIQIARSVVRLIASALTRRCRYSSPAGFGAGGASSFLSFLTFPPLPLTPLPFVLGIPAPLPRYTRSEEHTSELQSLRHLVCR